MAEKYRWIEKLGKHPLFESLVAESKGKLPHNESRNLLAERNGEIFVWCPSKNRVLTTNLKNVLFDNPCAKNYQALMCTSPPVFEVHMMRFSVTGKYLALVGEKGITVIEMPQRWGRFAEYQGGSHTINCRTIPVDERFFTVHANAMVLEVKWHPASTLDSHLVVLVSDNTLRIYNIIKPETPDQVINLGDPFSNDVSHSRGRLTSTSAFAIALGETSIAFDFAPPVSKSRLSHHRRRQEEQEVVYPMFILRENADVYYLIFELGKKGLSHEMVGPLTMHPATENNYGLDACSLLCLPVQPPVVVMATATGRIYHCIALETPGEDSDLEPGSDDESEKPSTPDIILYVHECVELQRSLSGRDADEVSSTVTQSEESFDSLNSCPVKLYPDDSSNNEYHCSHPSGAHTIVMPWIQKLQQFFVPGKYDKHIYK
ncbi:Nuclear pore complex protein Nup88 [Exaiptasia diaphana]|nr:Nuclear pore complex protein Nup88 [Exaiptasia diaphana]